MNDRLEICHCGHDKATHFVHEGKYATCLGMGCDPECRLFIDRDQTDRPERTQKVTPFLPPSDSWDLAKPHFDTDCQCSACLKWVQQHRYLYWP